MNNCNLLIQGLSWYVIGYAAALFYIWLVTRNHPYYNDPEDTMTSWEAQKGDFIMFAIFSWVSLVLAILLTIIEYLNSLNGKDK